MEDLLGLVVIVLYFILSAFSAKKKKADRARANTAQQKNRETVQFEQAFERAAPSYAEQTKIHEKAAYEGSTRATGMDAEPAGEGEDPCHVVRSAFEEELDEASPIENSLIFDTEDPDAFARDVLRGVIMSEILTRPQDRRRCAGMKRGA